MSVDLVQVRDEQSFFQQLPDLGERLLIVRAGSNYGPPMVIDSEETYVLTENITLTTHNLIELDNPYDDEFIDRALNVYFPLANSLALDSIIVAQISDFGELLHVMEKSRPDTVYIENSYLDDWSRDRLEVNDGSIHDILEQHNSILFMELTDNDTVEEAINTEVESRSERIVCSYGRISFPESTVNSSLIYAIQAVTRFVERPLNYVPVVGEDVSYFNHSMMNEQIDQLREKNVNTPFNTVRRGTVMGPGNTLSNNDIWGKAHHVMLANTIAKRIKYLFNYPKAAGINIDDSLVGRPVDEKMVDSIVQSAMDPYEIIGFEYEVGFESSTIVNISLIIDVYGELTDLEMSVDIGQ